METYMSLHAFHSQYLGYLCKRVMKVLNRFFTVWYEAVQRNEWQKP